MVGTAWPAAPHSDAWLWQGRRRGRGGGHVFFDVQGIRALQHCGKVGIRIFMASTVDRGLAYGTHKYLHMLKLVAADWHACMCGGGSDCNRPPRNNV